MYLRAGQNPPSSLVNGSVQDTEAHVKVKSVLAVPVWVDAANMDATVIKDNFVPVAQLCAGYAAACKAAGITG
jgi:D-xylose transport system substrate-binding protein